MKNAEHDEEQRFFDKNVSGSFLFTAHKDCFKRYLMI